MRHQGVGLAAGKRQAAAAQLRAAVRTPQSRSRAGTLPSRISIVCNVVTPSGSVIRWMFGKPTVRRARLPGGNRMVQEANASSRKEPGKRQPQGGASAIGPHNRLDTGMCLARKGADVDQVSL
jgi:hypothetical protein